MMARAWGTTKSPLEAERIDCRPVQDEGWIKSFEHWQEMLHWFPVSEWISVEIILLAHSSIVSAPMVNVGGPVCSTLKSTGRHLWCFVGCEDVRLLLLSSSERMFCVCRIRDSSQKENLGIVVQYKVKVRLILGFGSRWVLQGQGRPPIWTLHPFIYPSTNPSIHSSIHPLIHPLIYPLIHPLIHTSTHPSTHPSTNPSIHLSIHPFIHSSIHSSIHPLIHTFIHSYIQPLVLLSTILCLSTAIFQSSCHLLWPTRSQRSHHRPADQPAPSSREPMHSRAGDRVATHPLIRTSSSWRRSKMPASYFIKQFLIVVHHRTSSLPLLLVSL